MIFHKEYVLFCIAVLGLPVGIYCQPPQYGSIYCILNGDVLNVTIAIFTNGSDITGAEYFGVESQRVRYRSDDCLFTGNGSDSNPFRSNLQIDLLTDNPVAGQSYCGHILVPDTDPKEYRWITHAYKEFDREVEGDKYIQFQCTAEDLPTVLTSEYKVQVDVDTNITQNNGIIGLSVVSESGLIINSVNLGENISLRLEYQPSNFPVDDNTDPDLRPWGVYCLELYATPDLDSDNRVPLQNSQGCPRDDLDFLRPVTNFEQTGNQDKFIAETGILQAARFDKTETTGISANSGRVYFICLAEFCWRESDTKCQVRCSSITRRKRQAANQTVTLVTYIDVKTIPEDVPYVTEGPKVGESASFPVWYAVGLSVAAVLVLLLFVVFIMVLFKKRHQQTEKYQRHSNTPSLASLPISDKRSAATKMSNEQYRY